MDSSAAPPGAETSGSGSGFDAVRRTSRPERSGDQRVVYSIRGWTVPPSGALRCVPMQARCSILPASSGSGVGRPHSLTAVAGCSFRPSVAVGDGESGERRWHRLRAGDGGRSTPFRVLLRNVLTIPSRRFPGPLSLGASGEAVEGGSRSHCIQWDGLGGIGRSDRLTDLHAVIERPGYGFERSDQGVAAAGGTHLPVHRWAIRFRTERGFATDFDDPPRLRPAGVPE